VDEKLVAEARQAQDRLLDAEQHAEAARAEFRRAIRQLQLNGCSLRELASVLGLSHQRVQQIVAEGGGARRWSRGRPQQAGRGCTFCGRAAQDAAGLAAGPEVGICGTCLDLAAGVLATGTAAETGLGLLRAAPDQGKWERCSFCGQRRQQPGGLASMPTETSGKANGYASICAQCVSLCGEIVAAQRA
jgi:hypothetical protein